MNSSPPHSQKDNNMMEQKVSQFATPHICEANHQPVKLWMQSLVQLLFQSVNSIPFNVGSGVKLVIPYNLLGFWGDAQQFNEK